MMTVCFLFFFFFQAEDGIRYFHVTGVQTCALPISPVSSRVSRAQQISVVSPYSQNPPGSPQFPRNGGLPRLTSSSLARRSSTNASTVSRGSFFFLKGSVTGSPSPRPSPGRRGGGPVTFEELADLFGGAVRDELLRCIAVPVARQVTGIGRLEKTPADERDDAAVGLAPNGAPGGLHDARHPRLEVRVVKTRLFPIVEVAPEKLALE